MSVLRKLIQQWWNASKEIETNLRVQNIRMFLWLRTPFSIVVQTQRRLLKPYGLSELGWQAWYYNWVLVHCTVGGTEGVLRQLILGFEVSPWAQLSAFPAMPLNSSLRHLCSKALNLAVKVTFLLISASTILLTSWAWFDDFNIIHTVWRVYIKQCYDVSCLKYGPHTYIKMVQMIKMSFVWMCSICERVLLELLV